MEAILPPWISYDVSFDELVPAGLVPVGTPRAVFPVPFKNELNLAERLGQRRFTVLLATPG
jgi:hypothetical protein